MNRPVITSFFDGLFALSGLLDLLVCFFTGLILVSDSAAGSLFG
jgi:hypothetical protein